MKGIDSKKQRFFTQTDVLATQGRYFRLLVCVFIWNIMVFIYLWKLNSLSFQTWLDPKGKLYCNCSNRMSSWPDLCHQSGESRGVNFWIPVPAVYDNLKCKGKDALLVTGCHLFQEKNKPSITCCRVCYNCAIDTGSINLSTFFVPTELKLILCSIEFIVFKRICFAIVTFSNFCI